ncbi:MAG: trigger factor [Actinobacteria bacterium]|nr:trigger factor [Actinomycetota bacterium]
MATTVTETGPFERLVKFRLSDDQINEAKKTAARKLAGEVRIHGFRPGKAPLPVIEATLGADRVRREAIDGLVPPALSEVLSDEDLRPAITPELESLDEIEGGVEVEVRVTLWPTIDLPSYRDRRIEVTNPEVTEEDMTVQTRRMLEQFATVEEVERAAAEGDFVSIDVSATKDGVVVEDATVADLLYEVGSGGFLEGVDPHLVGATAGMRVGFDGPLPSGFGERAGEIVTYEIVVNEVKERILPDLTDEWVEENTEFDTVEELSARLREQLSDVKRRAVSREFTEKALSTLRDQLDLDLPEPLVRAEMDSQVHNFLHRLEEADISLDDYFRATGTDREMFVEDLRAQAEMSLRNRLILEAVADAEDIEVTEEEMSSVIQALAARSGDPVGYLKTFQESRQGLALASDMLRNRALDVILSNAQPVDEEGRPVDLSSRTTEERPVIVEALEDEEPGAGEVLATIVEEEE